ncbi:MAG TPA: hydroxyisourate hydrolase [Streptosporangiaceae bacterium]|nr:hydroxyisourate hydrolase [Streptosporangiaceae bacterium]
MSAISTHVLDVAAGCPAAGMRVRLERVESAGQDGQSGHEEIAADVTDANGRIASLGPDAVLPGTYRLVFDTGGYLAKQSDAPFFPEVIVTFAVTGRREHYHVPLLMSPFGYSTYRGS